MNIVSDIQERVEEFLGEKLVSSNSISGGCIANSYLIKLKSNKTYFLKTLQGNQSMFLKEANGLQELAKSKAIIIPQVILAGNNFLLLENIKKGNQQNNFFENFGTSFAHLHKHTSNAFGFFEDNYIGSTPQQNIAIKNEKTNWAEFYYNKRVMPQYRLAEQNGYSTSELSKGISLLENNIEQILLGSEEPPTLLHGDLWNGNYICDSFGNAVLIDPAVYYGHREADLAMTKMFGGFSSLFYQSYQETYPLTEGWQHREGLYLLYHYMNHLNLFGRSYYGECINLLRKYINGIT